MADNISLTGSHATAVKRTVLTPAFASWLQGYRVEGHEALNARLLTAIAEIRRSDPGLKSSNELGWHSQPGLFDWEHEAFVDLKRHIRDALALSIRQYWKEFDPSLHRTSSEGWINVNVTHAFNAPHSHAEAHLSGCYNVATPQPRDSKSGILQFLNPAGALVPNGKFGRRMVRPKLQVQPRAGDIYIFPSYLLHWVYPNLDDRERVSIAFNCTVEEPED
ncbi:MAG: hypothetical protein KDE55_15630 [Novosphingobium sp.]|nr:hypothetical protein [Novosphingobium sp.]